MDHLLWIGSCKFEKDVITRIYEKFPVGSGGRAYFQHVVISAQHIVDGIELHQRNHVALLEQIKIFKGRKNEDRTIWGLRNLKNSKRWSVDLRMFSNAARYRIRRVSVKCTDAMR